MTDAPLLTIGRLARLTDTKVQTIRYYEQVGVMPPARRSSGNQRLYTGEQRARLLFIRHARALGFSLDAIRNLLTLKDDPEKSCAEVDRIAREHLRDVDTKIARLQALHSELERMLRSCAGNQVGECRIIEVLSDHELCTHRRH